MLGTGGCCAVSCVCVCACARAASECGCDLFGCTVHIHEHRFAVIGLGLTRFVKRGKGSLVTENRKGVTASQLLTPPIPQHADAVGDPHTDYGTSRPSKAVCG